MDNTDNYKALTWSDSVALLGFHIHVPVYPRTLKLLVTLASHTNTWPSFEPVR